VMEFLTNLPPDVTCVLVGSRTFCAQRVAT
jgi:hypothetical protein